MKKILVTLLLATVLLPLTAAAQQWVEPSMQPDGTMIPGHWSTKGEAWQNFYSTPGMMNPFTGRFNSYGRKNPEPSLTTSNTIRSFTGIPGSNAPNPYVIPGSNAPNPYSALRSNPNKPTKEVPGAGKQQ